MSNDYKQVTSGEPSLFPAGIVPIGETSVGKTSVGEISHADARRMLEFEHEELLNEFLRSWSSPEPRDPEDYSVGFAAYHALAHAGILIRMRPPEARLRKIEGLSAEQRVKIVSDACGFAIGFGVPAHLTRILSDEAPEPEDIEEFEHILLQRDEFDVVIEFSKRLVGNVIETDDWLMTKLTDAISVAAEFDDAFLKRPDLMGVCSRSLLGIRPLNWLAGGSYPDWFTLARSWDTEPNIEQMLDMETRYGRAKGIPPA